MKTQFPKISIITPSFNQAPYIETTITSVLNQNYPVFEHIIIDGGSTDGTQHILARYPHLRWTSESDRGQADALNKGLARSTGQIIGWLNSDDFYHQNVFWRVAEIFQTRAANWVIGGVALYFDETGESIDLSSPCVSYDALIKNPDIVRQQGAFFAKDALLSVGGWNDDLFMVMDYDLWLRLAKRYQPEIVFSRWAYFRVQPSQKSSAHNVYRQTIEINKLLVRECAPLSVRLSFRLRRAWEMLKAVIKITLISRGIISRRFLNRPIRL